MSNSRTMSAANGTITPATGLGEGNNRTPVNGSPSEEQCGFKVFVGTLVHATRDDPMIILTHKALGVQDSKIQFVVEARQLKELQTQYGFPDSAVTHLSHRQFVMPGLVDTHIHAPQFPNNGLKLDVPLLEWLQKYTFPIEATFADVKFANHVYSRVVDRTLRNGTTTASYFATAHLEATKVLASIVASRGQRALVGKVNMSCNSPPNYREDNVEQSLRETEQFITYVNKELKNPLVSAIVTPRFAPNCPEEQLTGLGKLAARLSTHIQTHMSESRPEVAWVKQLFPERKNYADVYHHAGLLTKKTILAHCIWVTDEELEVMRWVGVGVSHCPSSNLNLFSGHCGVRRLLDHGIKVSLGTDCSGGYSPSILDALRRALHVSRSLALVQDDPDHHQHQPPKPLTLKEAFRLATLGGAQVVDMEDRIGNLEVGKEFDALLIDTEASGSPIDIFDKDTEQDIVEKFLYNGDDRNIVKVFVAGRCVMQHHHHHHSE